MKKYEPKDFNIPKIEGISEKTIETHLGLYKGYVNNLNKHYEEMMQNCKSSETLTAITRRISFELAGVQNHYTYFSSIEGGPKELDPNTNLAKTLQAQMGGVEGLKMGLRKMATEMRGVGWVIFVYDKKEDFFHMLWVVDHELGNVNLPALIAVDMWEHSYLIDYSPSEKSKYVDAYINALNWDVIAKTFDEIK